MSNWWPTLNRSCIGFYKQFSCITFIIFVIIPVYSLQICKKFALEFASCIIWNCSVLNTPSIVPFIRFFFFSHSLQKVINHMNHTHTHTHTCHYIFTYFWKQKFGPWPENLCLVLQNFLFIEWIFACIDFFFRFTIIQYLLWFLSFWVYLWYTYTLAIEWIGMNMTKQHLIIIIPDVNVNDRKKHLHIQTEKERERESGEPRRRNPIANILYPIGLVCRWTDQLLW